MNCAGAKRERGAFSPRINFRSPGDFEIISGEEKLLAPAGLQDARVAGVIVDGFRQLVLGVGRDALAGRFFLRGADLHEEVAAGNEALPGLGDEALEDLVPAGAAVQG